jgi:hypothetical protein
MAPQPSSSACRGELGVLRGALLGVGIAMLAGAVALAEAGCIPLGWRLALPGLVLSVAALFERWRYKRLAGAPPGSEWVATAERFVDPESGKLVTVYYRPATGERRYVAG